MQEMLTWPVDFDEPEPVTDFGNELITYFEQVIDWGAQVRAFASWTSFVISRNSRSVDFTWRGRLRRGAAMCWQVCLLAGGNSYQLGRLFGIREHACVVIARIQDLRTVTDRWLAGLPMESLSEGVTFWDRKNPTKPLSRALR